MKLHRKGRVAANRDMGANLAVLGGAEHVGIVIRIHVIAVYEVEVFTVINPRPQRVVVMLFDHIPAHVRYFQALFVGVAHITGKAVHTAFEKAQALYTAILFTALQ